MSLKNQVSSGQLILAEKNFFWSAETWRLLAVYVKGNLSINLPHFRNILSCLIHFYIVPWQCRRKNVFMTAKHVKNNECKQEIKEHIES